ncbi:MAG: type II toxin-antitoxin system RelE/ParE family toxin [Clostridiales bacterium]|jgi:mRNA interferase RelE/StbE|nr:type II toxin-antitoxin system RelE/ParE family toxin [Clostridiales bacterium]
MYRVEYDKAASKQLEKMDKFQAKRITDWVKDNLEGIENPRSIGRKLALKELGDWRYKVGDYRILVRILDKEVVIKVVAAGHRRKVYRR